MEGAGRMTQLSLKEAKRLSIIKWEAHVKAGGYCYPLPIELRNLKAGCGFCERWLKEATDRSKCKNCEFGKLAGICFEPDSLFCKWNEDLETATEILNIIKSIPDE